MYYKDCAFVHKLSSQYFLNFVCGTPAGLWQDSGGNSGGDKSYIHNNICVRMNDYHVEMSKCIYISKYCNAPVFLIACY